MPYQALAIIFFQCRLLYIDYRTLYNLLTIGIYKPTTRLSLHKHLLTNNPGGDFENKKKFQPCVDGHRRGRPVKKKPKPLRNNRSGLIKYVFRCWLFKFALVSTILTAIGIFHGKKILYTHIVIHLFGFVSDELPAML